MTSQRREKGSSIARVLEIIEAVSKTDRPLSPADLALLLDIPKPSVHRLLQQLEADGYLQTNMRGLIVPADRLHDIALGVLYTSRFKAVRKSILKNLASKVGETCGISIPDGVEMIYYDREQTNWPLQVHLPIGSHTPVWCSASGKLYLSSLPADRRQSIINNLPLDQRARNTITSTEALETAVLDIAEQDLGIDNEELVDGMVAISVPIRDKTGKLFACLFTHAPIIRKSLDELKEFEPILREAAEELGQLISQDSYDES